MARHKLFGVYPSYVSRTAWIHGLVSVISCGKFSVIVTSIIFSAPFSLSFSSDIPIMCMLYLLQLSHSLYGYYVPFFFSFVFQFWEVSIGISFSSLVPLLVHGQFTYDLIKGILHFCYSTFDFHHF